MVPFNEAWIETGAAITGNRTVKACVLSRPDGGAAEQQAAGVTAATADDRAAAINTYTDGGWNPEENPA